MPKTLSIVIPAYNEAKTLEQIIQKIIVLKLSCFFEKEIIVINDCSTDNTREILSKIEQEYPQIRILHNRHNLGKSISVKKGILVSTGDFVIVQDADLEYNPKDICFILQQTIQHKCQVGFGNRFGKNNGIVYPRFFYGNLLLSFFSNLITIHRIKVNIPDMEVCYKLIQGDVAREIAAKMVSQSNFGLEPEITARLSRYKLNNKNLNFIILPISYNPRSIQEGKKMRVLKDGLAAFLEIIRFNFF